MMQLSWWQSLKHAFSLNCYDEPFTEKEHLLLDRIALAIVRRRMQVPSLFLLESAKPLNYLGSQAMTFFEPMIRLLFPTTEYGEIRRILERRHSIEWLLTRIEEHSARTDLETVTKVEEKFR